MDLYRFEYSFIIVVSEKFCFMCFFALRASFRARVGFVIRVWMADWSSVRFCGVVSRPVFWWSIISVRPVVLVAITGRPAAMASRVARLMPSVVLGMMKMLADLRHRSVSRRKPVKITEFLICRFSVSCSSRRRSGPSPTISSWRWCDLFR